MYLVAVLSSMAYWTASCSLLSDEEATIDVIQTDAGSTRVNRVGAVGVVNAMLPMVAGVHTGVPSVR